MPVTKVLKMSGKLQKMKEEFQNLLKNMKDARKFGRKCLTRMAKLGWSLDDVFGEVLEEDEGWQQGKHDKVEEQCVYSCFVLHRGRVGRNLPRRKPHLHMCNPRLALLQLASISKMPPRSDSLETL
jgi:hypothetical protein